MIAWILVVVLYLCGAVVFYTQNSGYTWQDWVDIILWPLGVFMTVLIRPIIMWFKYGDRG